MKRLLVVLFLLLASVGSKAQELPPFTPATKTRMADLYIAAARTFMGAGKDEFAMTVDDEGNPSEITTSHDYMRDIVHVHKGDTAIIHTHPYGCSPQPSPGDAQTARAAGIPNYVLSQFALWVVMPDGTIHKVADVAFKHGGIVLKEAK